MRRVRVTAERSISLVATRTGHAREFQRTYPLARTYTHTYTHIPTEKETAIRKFKLARINSEGQKTISVTYVNPLITQKCMFGTLKSSLYFWWCGKRARKAGFVFVRIWIICYTRKRWGRVRHFWGIRCPVFFVVFLVVVCWEEAEEGGEPQRKVPE